MSFRRSSKQIVTPFSIPTWTGAVNYYSSIYKCLNELMEEDETFVDWHGRRTSEKNISHQKHNSMSKYIFKSLDLLRSQLHPSFPYPISKYAKSSFHWIPDLQDIELPEMFSTYELKKRSKKIHSAYQNGDIFFFSSQHARAIFERTYNMNDRISGIVRFANINKTKNFQTISSTKISCEKCLDGNYLYLPNQWWKHKNHLQFFEIFRKYKDAGGELHLVLTGSEIDPRHPHYKSEVLEKINDFNAIHNLGFIDRMLQTSLFTSAKALIQPSKYEGWSSTIEEGISFGVPIIASDIPVHREQMELVDNASLIDFNNSEKVLETLFKIPPFRNETQLIRMNEFRWNRFKSDLKTTIRNGINLLNLEKQL